MHSAALRCTHCACLHNSFMPVMSMVCWPVIKLPPVFHTQCSTGAGGLASPAVTLFAVPCFRQEFHFMAQQCSARATIHFLHSMNWVREVKGVSWVDWILDRLAVLEEGQQEAADAVKEVSDAACWLHGLARRRSCQQSCWCRSCYMACMHACFAERCAQG